jgi:hypothetical protein
MPSKNMEGGGGIVFFPHKQHRYGRYSVSGIGGKWVLCQNGNYFSFNENSLLAMTEKRRKIIGKNDTKIRESWLTKNPPNYFLSYSRWVKV